MSNTQLTIKEEPNVFDDNILDIWGNAFNFSHEKGLAEWLKNSVDAYRRAGAPDKDQHIVFRFTDGKDSSNPPTIECIDFVGMEYLDIEKALKRWGDPNAAKRGQKIKVFGGHGNGGKFYMRQMFQQSYYFTYKQGKLNVFGFNKDRKYGFSPDYKDKKVSLEEAFKVAGIDRSIIPNAIIRQLEHGETGFTVVKGIRPKNLVGNKLPVYRICDKLKYHPQARSPLKFSNVSVIHNDKILVNSLRVEAIEPLEGFEGPFLFDIPDFLDAIEGDKKISMSNKKYGKGSLVLKTSSLPFGRGGRKAELNCIDIAGEIGIIASYSMEQVGFLQYFPQAQYIYGECSCPILEDPEYDSVQNDREKLVENERTQALLQWIARRIDEVAGKIADKEAKKEEENSMKASDEFNKILNKWKNQFMSKLFAELFGGSGKGDSTGGLGDDGSGGGENKESKTKGGLGSGSGKGGGDGEEKKKGSAFPMVLLSERDRDPDYPDIPVTFSERHPAVQQRPQDVSRGIYWINMSKPMAKKISEKYGEDSIEMRNYIFERYVDIFTKETIWREAKKQGGTLTPEQIDDRITYVASLVYDTAMVDLEEALLDRKYTSKKGDEVHSENEPKQ